MYYDAVEDINKVSDHFWHTHKNTTLDFTDAAFAGDEVLDMVSTERFWDLQIKALITPEVPSSLQAALNEYLAGSWKDETSYLGDQNKDTFVHAGEDVDRAGKYVNAECKNYR